MLVNVESPNTFDAHATPVAQFSPFFPLVWPASQDKHLVERCFGQSTPTALHNQVMVGRSQKVFVNKGKERKKERKPLF